MFDHCRYAGYVAEGLCALSPDALRRLLPPETPFLAALHDVGKVSPGFAGKYFMPLLREKAPWFATGVENGRFVTDHAAIGARALQRLFGLTADHPLVQAVAAHHGFVPDQMQFSRDGVWQNEREALVRALAAEFGVAPEASVRAEVPADLLCGITCVADWIASDEEFFPPDEAPLPSAEGRKRAAEALAACGFALPSFRPGLSFRDVFGVEPYPAQRAFFEEVTGPGVYVLEAPMGMGKTEAALYAAYRLIAQGVHSGLYFALPTRLTSDRIHERVERFLKAVSAESPAVKLAHGQAWLKEFATGAEGSDGMADRRPPPWFNPSKRGLLFPYAVGTIDQALLAVLNVKHSFVRSFGLAGKVVILDEVHSYDAYTGTLLDQLVARLRALGCTVIVLSATLTSARRAALFGDDAPTGDGYPLLSGLLAGTGGKTVRALEPPPSRTVRLRWLDASAEPPMAAAIAKARAGCNVLCIANTVPTAQEWFRALLTELRGGDDFPIGLLHAKFTGADRERIEAEWMSKLGKPPASGPDPRPRGSILVATQIVEQSVDIDADWMLSELAPADMLLQRLGRLWRHDRATRPAPAPELAVVCSRIPADALSGLPPETKALEAYFGRGVWVYAPYVLLRSFETLRPRALLRIPDDIRPLLETVYSETIPATPLHRRLHAEMRAKAELLRRLALMSSADSLPTRDDAESAAGTRYDSRPSVPLLLVRSLEPPPGDRGHHAELLDGSAVEITPDRRDLSVTRALYRNLVQVAPNDALLSEADASAILGRHFFASEMPRICIWNPATGALRLHATGRDAGYAYDSTFGAYRIAPGNGIAPPLSPPRDRLDTGPAGDFIFGNGSDW